MTMSQPMTACARVGDTLMSSCVTPGRIASRCCVYSGSVPAGVALATTEETEELDHVGRLTRDCQWRG